MEKFLEFNGKTIFFLAKDGAYWIAIKPICEALSINYDRQYKNLKSHPAFSQLYAKQPMTGADDKVYQMVALPEKYIYGWLFNIRSSNSGLVKYQLECCSILFDYFHGSITSRETLIREKAKREVEIERLVNTADGAKLRAHYRTIKKINTSLRKMDLDIHKEQMELFKS